MKNLKLTIVLFLLSLLTLAVLACASIKPAVHDAHEVAARVLCETTFVEKTGLAPEEVRRIYCDSREHIEPFLKAVKEAAHRSDEARSPTE